MRREKGIGSIIGQIGAKFMKYNKKSTVCIGQTHNDKNGSIFNGLLKTPISPLYKPPLCVRDAQRTHNNEIENAA